MRTSLRWIAPAAAAILLSGAPAWGGSIWAKASRRVVPHTDDTARKIGDILTIIINERSVIENETKREMSKQSQQSATATGELTLPYIVSLLNNHNFNSPNLSLNQSVDVTRKRDDEVDYESERLMTDKMTVTVADVLPNGNLVVLGSRERQTAGDKQTVQVSGVVRPSDITFANTVASESVADFKILFKKSGIEKDFVRQSVFDWVLSIFNLF